ncbi:hypothetical protein GJ744_001610 [Endocarpon pusillum]|uniref:Uncharacterized protein n=1 Tax=Endocarpon pusillum TaxID=364733 RepID=A0A8H7ACC8_9EURO|nr:hypothetical protein GJ744_001610 [Endocarpon pusillum]
MIPQRAGASLECLKTDTCSSPLTGVDPRKWGYFGSASQSHRVASQVEEAAAKDRDC